MLKSLWQHLQRFLGIQVIPVDPSVLDKLQNLAEREQRPKEAVAAELLSIALIQRGAAEASLQSWRALSYREREVAALICLDYTNAEIAVRLSISLPTVKSHVRNILRKFGVSRRADLRAVLAAWDFSAWDRAPR